MKGKTAGLVFLGICLALAVLLLTNTITPVVSGVVFAAGLATFGWISKGFKKK